MKQNLNNKNIFTPILVTLSIVAAEIAIMPEMALFVVYVKIFVSIFSTVQVPGIGFFVWSSSKRDLSHRVTSA